MAILLSFVAPAHAILNIPGEEITSRKPGASFDSHHLIAVGHKRHVDPGLSLQSQINAVNAQGGVAILPHPLYRRGDGAPGFSLSTLRRVRGHIGTELTDSMSDVRSGARYWGWDYGAGSSPLVSQILGGSQRSWGFRDPDTNILSVDSLRSSTVVRAKGLTRRKIINALRRGDFYAVRSRQGGSIAKKRSFPVPIVDFAKGTITIFPRAGYSVRMFRADSNAPLLGTCTYRTKRGRTVRRSDDTCANDRYPVRFVYKVKGGETYVKAVVTNYADRRNLSNAQYQPIIVAKSGYIVSSPYSEPTNPKVKRFVGAIHIHTGRSGDNPKGVSPAATLRWFKKRSYDWIAMTDHNKMSNDVWRPRPKALSSRTVKKGEKVGLPFRVKDSSSVKAYVKIKNSRGKTVKYVRVGWRQANRKHKETITADLPKGRYRWGVVAKDSALNWSSDTSWSYLRVK